MQYKIITDKIRDAGELEYRKSKKNNLKFSQKDRGDEKHLHNSRSRIISVIHETDSPCSTSAGIALRFSDEQSEKHGSQRYYTFL